MSESEQESGAIEKSPSVDWAEALTETFKKATAEPESAPVAAAEEKPADVQPEETTPVVALQPHERWSEEVKTRFSSLDKDTQQFLLDREKDVEGHLTKRTQELSDYQRRYERLDGVLKPWEEVAKRQGIDLAPVVGQAINYYAAYQRDPVGTIKTLIQASQLSPETLFGQGDADPTISALRTEIGQLKSELANVRQGQVQATDSQTAQQIEAFKTAKDEKGESKHPHFEDVRALMAPLVEQGKSLEEAYNTVIWTVPEYRQAAEKAALAKAEKEAKEKADKARMEKVRSAKRAETLPAADADKGTGKKKLSDIGGWAGALLETQRQLSQ